MNSLFRQINMKNSNDNTDNSFNEALFDNFPQHTHTYTHRVLPAYHHHTTFFFFLFITQLLVPRGTEKPPDLCKAEFGNRTWKH